MNTPKKIRIDVPFTFVCLECDAGMDIQSYEHALAEGWTEIDYSPDLPMANYVGLCPQCQESYDNWPRVEDWIN